MCMICQRAVLKLRKKTGWSRVTAMGFLWSNTAFPVGDGASVLAEVERFLRVKPKNRRRWLRKENRRFDRSMERISADEVL